jgi:hypothetical protein
MNAQTLAISLFFMVILIGGVNAAIPPASVQIAGTVSTHDQIGIFWVIPNDPDYGGVNVWFDNQFVGQKSETTEFYYEEFLSTGNHTFSSQSVSKGGVVSGGWVNVTVENRGYFTCDETFYIDTCPLPIPGYVKQKVVYREDVNEIPIDPVIPVGALLVCMVVVIISKKRGG